jgi:hypothetical protein
MDKNTNKPTLMTPRDRILKAVNHQPVDEFPTDIWVVSEMWVKLGAYFDTQDRIEIHDHFGVDVLIPIQWRCGDWDLDWLKDDFRQALCFHGGIDNQQNPAFWLGG